MISIHSKPMDISQDGFTGTTQPFPMKNKNRCPRIRNCQLQLKSRLGQWFIHVHVPVKSLVQRRKRPVSVCSIDPGVRSFLTGFDVNRGCFWDVGASDMTRIQRLCYHLDQLMSRMKQARHRQRYKMKRAAQRLRDRVRNLVDEVHKKTALWIVQNYSVIVIPKFDVSTMVTKKSSTGRCRKIGRKTVRAMLTWSHFRFRHRLVNKSRIYNTHVVVCDEVYTSKTCSGCGFVDEKLGGKKIFKCPTCKLVIDRDCNGAKNILLRYLTLQQKNSG